MKTRIAVILAMLGVLSCRPDQPYPDCSEWVTVNSITPAHDAFVRVRFEIDSKSPMVRIRAIMYTDYRKDERIFWIHPNYYGCCSMEVMPDTELYFSEEPYQTECKMF